MVNLIFGPPGTGKTHTLLGIVEDALNKGIEPDRIGYFAFTRKASREAIDRALERFPQYEKKDFKYFKTLHSMAYFELGLTDNSLMDDADYKELSNHLNIKISNPKNRFDNYGVGWQDDRYTQIIDKARIRNVSLEHQFCEPSRGHLSGGLLKLRKIATGLNRYKKQNGFMDFTDMLEEFIKRKSSPKFKLLIIDEAQDLSSLQWDMVDILIKNSKEVYIAGDDDQAIFKWAGADPWRFKNQKGNRIIFDQSYRVPRAVQHKALNVINRIPGDQRVEKSWKSVDREGLFKIHTNPIPGMDFLKDDWLILTRTNHLLDKIEVELQSRGIFYQRHNSKSVSDKLLLAINTWTKLTRGKSVSLEGVKAMYNFMSVNVGVSYGFKTMPGGQEDKEYTYDLLKKDYGLLAGKDLIWHVALDQVSDKKIAYIISALKKDQNLNYEAKIKLSTIHGSKGGQAQNVLLFSDLTYKVDTEYMRDRSDERRVFYVGMTRAKEQLHVVRSQTNREFKEMFW